MYIMPFVYCPRGVQHNCGPLVRNPLNLLNLVCLLHIMPSSLPACISARTATSSHVLPVSAHTAHCMYRTAHYARCLCCPPQVQPEIVAYCENFERQLHILEPGFLVRQGQLEEQLRRQPQQQVCVREGEEGAASWRHPQQQVCVGGGEEGAASWHQYRPNGSSCR